MSCLSDVFTVNVSAAAQKITATGALQNKHAEVVAATSVRVHPTLLSRGQPLYITGLNKNTSCTIVDVHGRVVQTAALNNYSSAIPTGRLVPGVYFIKWIQGTRAETRKFIIAN